MSVYLKRIDLSKLYPHFACKVVLLADILAAKGVPFYATSGLRSWEEQQALYDQGRIKPGDIVTNAKPGYSLHNFGLAVDFCRDADLKREGLQPSWKDADYKVLAQEALKLGLESGWFWTSPHDAPHIQLPLDDRKITKAKLRSLYAGGGLTAVWKHLDGFSW